MPAIVAGLKYPYSRVLLPRTRLAYVHLRNLLTDAKRDRAARVSGYVAVWLPEEFVILYLQRGEVVNSTVMDKTGAWKSVAISTALERIPAEPPTKPASTCGRSSLGLGNRNCWTRHRVSRSRDRNAPHTANLGL